MPFLPQKMHRSRVPDMTDEPKTVIRLFPRNPRAQLERKPTKRPVGEKSSISSLYSSSDSSGHELKSWGFTSLREIIGNTDTLTQESLQNALQHYITFLTTMRHNFDHKYQKLEAAIQRPVASAEPIRRHVKFEQEIRPTKTAVAQIITPPSIIKPKKRTKSDMAPSETSSRNYNSSTIWVNINKFFSETPTLEMYRKYLTPSVPPSTSIQLGPHYADTINQRLKAKIKTSTVVLKVPQSFVESGDTFSEASASVIFHRLLSSIVRINTDPRKPIIGDTTENAALISIPEARSTIIPTNIPGTSPYSQLTFEQKLICEVNALELNANDTQPKLTDNEVNDDIIEKGKELADLMRETNELRAEITRLLREKEPTLLKRAEQAKHWTKAPPKSESGTASKSSARSKRDKLD